jgi:hypothetical protein
MKQSQTLPDSPISCFLNDTFKRLNKNKITLYEQFLFSFLIPKNNFEVIFKILYSAFQSDLITSSSEFSLDEPPNIASNSCEFIILRMDYFIKYQNKMEN